jgi:formate hydrogenlyase subunit 3/multisubunit Na+/H+ antiporter MnhD subunit
MNNNLLSAINLPALLLSALLLLALLTYFLRAWERFTNGLATVSTGLLAIWLWNIDLNTPLRPLPFSSQQVDLTAPLVYWNFSFQLQASTTPMLVACLLLSAAACAIAAHISQGERFTSAILILLTGYVGLALMTSGPLPPPLLTPLFLIVLSGLCVFVLQSGRYTHPSGPLRILAPPVLAFPLFLLSFWYIDQIPLNPQDVWAQQSAAHLLSLGLLLLMAPVPLHGAQPATAQSAPPLVMAVVTLLYQLAVLNLLFRLTLTFPFMAQENALHDWLTWAGIATAVWGGIAAIGANHPGRLWGYAALHDWGLILLVLAIPGLRSWLLVLFLFGLRSVSMLTAAAGLAVLEVRLGNLSAASLRGAATRLPFNSVAFLLGGLGLAGFPLSAGFTGHWAALQLVAENDWLSAAAVLVASGGVIFGFIRLARELFTPLQSRYASNEGWVSATLAILVLLLSTGLAIAPQWLDNPITRTLAALRS